MSKMSLLSCNILMFDMLIGTGQRQMCCRWSPDRNKLSSCDGQRLLCNLRIVRYSVQRQWPLRGRYRCCCSCLVPDGQRRITTSGCQLRVYWIVWIPKRDDSLSKIRKWDSTCERMCFNRFRRFDSTLHSLTFHYSEDLTLRRSTEDWYKRNEECKTRVGIDYFQHYLKDGSNFSLRHRERTYSPLTFHPTPVWSSLTYSRERAGVHHPDPKISFGDKEAI
jgi:hypothetical protein